MFEVSDEVFMNAIRMAVSRIIKRSPDFAAVGMDNLIEVISQEVYLQLSSFDRM